MSHPTSEVGLERRLRPEDEELARLEARLAALEEQRADRELELATLKHELQAFEQRFLSMVGVRQSELDALEARIAALIAAGDPSDEAQEAARTTAAQANLSAEELGDRREAPSEIAELLLEIPDDLRWIYREVAKAVHPDFAVDESDRTVREAAMTAANAAYDSGDAGQLRAILDDWEARPEAVPGEDVGARIIRAIRRIAAVETRLTALDLEIQEVRQNVLVELRTQSIELASRGRDLLQEMAAALERRIDEARRRLDDLVAPTEAAAGADAAGPVA